jgi:hypothetical protein
VISDEFFAPSFWSKYCNKRFHLNLLANENNLNIDFLKVVGGDNPNVVFFPWKMPQLSGFRTIETFCLHI